MKLRTFMLVPLILLAGAGVVLFGVWPRNHQEVQVRETRWSPDRKRAAVIQMEVSGAGTVNDAVYTVRLKGIGQHDAGGDLVLNVPVSYPDPQPAIDWRSEGLVITLAEKEKYQYFVQPVDGITVVLLRTGSAEVRADLRR